MRHLSWQLEAAQHALAQQQEQGQEQGHPLTRSTAGVDEGGPSPSALAADLSAAQARASSAERQCAQVLQFLADEAATLTPQGLVTHCMSDELLEGVSGTIASLVSLHTEPLKSRHIRCACTLCLPIAAFVAATVAKSLRACKPELDRGSTVQLTWAAIDVHGMGR
jgi:hypothetical protein